VLASNARLAGALASVGVAAVEVLLLSVLGRAWAHRVELPRQRLTPKSATWRNRVCMILLPDE
jgi:hypothetical protein